MLTEQNRAMIKAFCDKFRDYEKVPMELRIEGKEIRRFLEQYGVTLQTFNKMTSCLGRTTGNRYAYSIPCLLYTSSANLLELKVRAPLVHTEALLVSELAKKIQKDIWDKAGRPTMFGHTNGQDNGEKELPELAHEVMVYLSCLLYTSSRPRRKPVLSGRRR